MKRIFILSAVLLLCGITMGQDDPEVMVEQVDIKVEETTKTMSKGSQLGIKIDIYKVDVETLKGWWGRHVKREGGSRVELEGSEMIVKDALIEFISQKPVNVYALFIPFPDHIEWHTFYEMDSVFLTRKENEVEFLSAKQFSRDFAINASKKAAEIEIEREEKILNDIEKELTSLLKELQKQQDLIKDAERWIELSEDEIKTAEISLSVARDKLKSQKQETASLDSEDYIKVSEKKEREIEKEIKRFQREKEELFREKDNRAEAIKDAQAKIPEIQIMIDEQQAALENQQVALNRLEQKLASIE